MGQQGRRPPAVPACLAPWLGRAAAGAQEHHHVPRRQRRRPGSAPRSDAAAMGPGRHTTTLGERNREREKEREEGKAAAGAAEVPRYGRASGSRS